MTLYYEIPMLSNKIMKTIYMNTSKQWKYYINIFFCVILVLVHFFLNVLTNKLSVLFGWISYNVVIVAYELIYLIDSLKIYILLWFFLNMISGICICS